MKIRLEKIIKIFFAGIITFVLLEFILFALGQYLIGSRRNLEAEHGKAIQIICTGDSHTFGVGTSSAYSYPGQLENLLNTNNPSQKFSVVNLGIPGASAGRQIKELAAFLDKGVVHPKIIILLTGRNSYLEEKSWQNSSIFNRISSQINRLRSPRFLKEAFRHFIKQKRHPSDNLIVSRSAHNDYLSFWLQRCKGWCFKHGAKLILLSYYNSTDEAVKNFAQQNNLLYFDFSNEFKQLFSVEEKTKYLSPDMSHMNHKGYKLFAEQLYENLFLNQQRLNLTISPLLKKIQDSSFYADRPEIEQLIQRQAARIDQHRGRPDYPFELIHLGHIYMEMGDVRQARELYMQGLTASNYCDNNTIAAPIINWYLRSGDKEGALRTCEEILSHNPQNKIALHYKRWVLQDMPTGNPRR